MAVPQHSAFFDSTENLAALQLLARRLRTSSPEMHSDSIARALLRIVDLMAANAPKFDEYATFNVEWIGKGFFVAIHQYLEDSSGNKPEALTDLFTMAYRFLSELTFTQPGEPSMEVRAVEAFVDKHMEAFHPMDRQQIHFARYSMPIQIAKMLLNDPSIVEFRKFSQMVGEAKELRSNWDSELEQRKSQVDAIKDALKDATSSYNFVGLVSGFRQLASAKLAERKLAFGSLIVLAVVMVLPPILQVIYVAWNIDILESKKSLLVYTLPTIIALEVILVYFFRVVLSQFRSVKAQLLQLDLRIALCQFVQSYAEYASRVKKDDPASLAKFEALIFSGLVADNDGIPSTFDGTEQLSNLIKSIRSS